MTSELIVYLEPAKSSALSKQVEEYFAASRLKPWRGNEALRYPAHITMVGFFHDPDSSPSSSVMTAAAPTISPSPAAAAAAANAVATDVSTTVKDQLIRHLNQSIQQLNDTSKSQRRTPTRIQGLVRPHPDSLLIAIRPSPDLLTLIQTISKQFPALGWRLKRINHLSLCYWDDADSHPPFQAIVVEATTAPAAIREKEEKQNRRQREMWTDQATRLAETCIPMLRREQLSKEETQQRADQMIGDDQSGRGDALDGNLLSSSGSTSESMPVWEESWDIVLYSIQNRNKANGLPYSLVELKRWRLA